MSAPLTEQAAALTIEGACRTLRLPTIRELDRPLEQIESLALHPAPNENAWLLGPVAVRRTAGRAEHRRMVAVRLRLFMGRAIATSTGRLPAAGRLAAIRAALPLQILTESGADGTDMPVLSISANCSGSTGRLK